MSLKALARERLALIRAGETPDETPGETLKQPVSVFHEGETESGPMKHANPRETAENGDCFTVSAPRERNDETPNDLQGLANSLPPEIHAGVERLKHQPTPRLRRPAVWPEIVADAVRLAEQGWAESALALGWSPLNLWGVSFAAGGIADLEGVAVWLAGGVPLFGADYVAVREAPGSYRCMKRRPMEGAVYLWELGR